MECPNCGYHVPRERRCQCGHRLGQHHIDEGPCRWITCNCQAFMWQPKDDQ